MSLDRINPGELPAPSGFSHAVRAAGTIRVHLAGQTALDRDGRIIGQTVVAQFEQALDNLLTALRAAGGEPSDLASLTIYVVDLENYREHGAEIGAVWRRLVGRHYPAMAAVGVARLWDVAALVEVQGVAEVAAGGRG
jgi:enamine deaminase RidA (YjgF/YER057c/UK114 family)